MYFPYVRGRQYELLALRELAGHYITNPALKYYEAVSKLAKWYNTSPHPVEITLGIQTFLQHYEQQSYPGLGTVKKLSLMHHLELMGKYLNEVG